MFVSHPFSRLKDIKDWYSDKVPMLSASYITDSMGTGFVHLAPSHGDEDYCTWSSHTDYLDMNGISSVVDQTLDDEGRYTEIMSPRFEGLEVIRLSGKKRGEDGPANNTVINALVESKCIASRSISKVNDAHSWRSKSRIIRRAVPQWFIKIDDETRGKFYDSIEDKKFIPKSSKNRLLSMFDNRPDWLISRQRKWGVPITLLVHSSGMLHTERQDVEYINAKILKSIEKNGVDGWFDMPVHDLIKQNHSEWSKVTDILDVWFDSGCTKIFTLESDYDMPNRADLYIEGSDQHRGWFQSSTTISSLLKKDAPFDNLVTHGFVVDKDGRKMSKSEGNVIHPNDILNKYGVDTLRIWVANSDYTKDIKCSEESISSAYDLYKKIRNTFKFVSGFSHEFNTYDINDVELPLLDKYMMNRIQSLSLTLKSYITGFDVKSYLSEVFDLINEISSFYFDIRKDSLYCDPYYSQRRIACICVLESAAKCLTDYLYPITPLLCSEFNSNCELIHSYSNSRFISERDIISLSEQELQAVNSLKILRSNIKANLDLAKIEKTISSDLEARVISCVPELLYPFYTEEDPLKDSLSDLLVVSDFSEISFDDKRKSIENLSDHGYKKCSRSWKYFSGEGDVTKRDKLALEEFSL